MGTISEDNMRTILGFNLHEELKFDKNVSILMDYVAGVGMLDTDDSNTRAIGIYEVYSYYKAVENNEHSLESVQSELKKITSKKLKLADRLFDHITEENVLRLVNLYHIAFEKGHFKEFVKTRFHDWKIKAGIWRSNWEKMLKKLRFLLINCYLSNCSSISEIKNVIRRLCHTVIINLNRVQIILTKFINIKDIINYRQDKDIEGDAFDSTNQMIDAIKYQNDPLYFKKLSQI